MSYLMRRDPFRGLVRLQDEMDRLFQTFFGQHGAGEERPLGVRVPAVDVTETEADVIVKAELPGVTRDHLELEVLPEVLTLKATMSETKEEEGAAYHRRERTWARFERSVPLPAEVKADAVKAKLQDGVLEVRLPKSQRAKAATPRKVEVE
jgi:HSP20 family protein